MLVRLDRISDVVGLAQPYLTQQPLLRHSRAQVALQAKTEAAAEAGCAKAETGNARLHYSSLPQGGGAGAKLDGAATLTLCVQRMKHTPSDRSERQFGFLRQAVQGGSPSTALQGFRVDWRACLPRCATPIKRLLRAVAGRWVRF